MGKYDDLKCSRCGSDNIEIGHATGITGYTCYDCHFIENIEVNKYMTSGAYIDKVQYAFGNTSVSCPNCHSSNCKKIGAVSRAVSVGVMGLASSKIGKQWHCNNCGSNF